MSDIYTYEQPYSDQPPMNSPGSSRKKIIIIGVIALLVLVALLSVILSLAGRGDGNNIAPDGVSSQQEDTVSGVIRAVEQADYDEFSKLLHGGSQGGSISQDEFNAITGAMREFLYDCVISENQQVRYAEEDSTSVALVSITCSDDIGYTVILQREQSASEWKYAMMVEDTNE